MSEQPVPHTATPKPPAHEHTAPSKEGAFAYGQVVRVQKAMQSVHDHIESLQNIFRQLAQSSALLQRDEPYCDTFEQALVIVEDELHAFTEVRARAKERLKLATEGCAFAQAKEQTESPGNNGVAS